jgi:hypothetical protein
VVETVQKDAILFYKPNGFMEEADQVQLKQKTQDQVLVIAVEQKLAKRKEKDLVAVVCSGFNQNIPA